jgi:uncharacterized protein (DUF1778 family)
MTIQSPDRPVRPRSQKRQRPSIAAVRLTPAEKDRLSEVAQREGKSVSMFMRDLVLQATA